MQPSVLSFRLFSGKLSDLPFFRLPITFISTLLSPSLSFKVYGPVVGGGRHVFGGRDRMSRRRSVAPL
jgi:hypothetical protein